MSNLVEHAKFELQLQGYGPNMRDEMERQIYNRTLEIVEAFSECGHSGGSASYHVEMINRLLQFKALGRISDNPEEWVDVTDNLWQNRRDSSMFSEDAGKTYYCVDEFRRGWKRKLFGRRGKTYKSMPSKGVKY